MDPETLSNTLAEVKAEALVDTLEAETLSNTLVETKAEALANSLGDTVPEVETKT